MNVDRPELIELKSMIITKRLFLRRVCAADWKAFQTIWTEVAKTQYAQYDKPKDTADQAVEQRVKQWASFADSTEHMFFSVCLDQTVIGFVALHKRENGFEMGYCFHPDYHGKGYAKESISGLLNALKAQGLSRITAGTALKNLPSVNLLLSLGFQQVDTERVSFYQDMQGKDVFFDGGIFELLL